ncbi:MAG: hypothetical protein JWO86_1134 [Myxococcaceae bacterium]|jgi:hypothetical protein|nr:hypothetical protein [Myxococcaceae bacterium]
MDTFERIELRRFVGRELLLWLWFESEVFEATLSTKVHGSFGLWLEGRLVLSAGQEVTTIKGTIPGQHREAKEALLRGKMPDLAAVHISWADHDATLTLKAETLGISGLKLPRKEPDAAPPGEGTTVPVRRAPRRRAAPAAAAAELAASEANEDLYERMRVTREIEGIVEALYRDFLALRLGPAWSEVVVPALEAWTSGAEVDADRYGTLRTRALTAAAGSRGSPKK